MKKTDILLVDDEESMREMYDAALSTAGFTTVAAESVIDGRFDP